MNKLIISIIILIITISTSYCIKINNNNHDKEILSGSSAAYYLTFTPYDSECKNEIPGIGFGVYNGGCVYNYSITFAGGNMCADVTNDPSNQYVNLTSYAYDYDQTIINASKIFEINKCGFYEYSNTNYFVSYTKSKDIPKDQWVIETLDIFCETVGSYWFVSPGISIPDKAANQTNTYECKDKIGYTTTCNGIVAGHMDDCIKLENPPGCSFLSDDATSIYCSYGWFDV